MHAVFISHGAKLYWCLLLLLVSFSFLLVGLIVLSLWRPPTALAGTSNWNRSKVTRESGQDVGSSAAKSPIEPSCDPAWEIVPSDNAREITVLSSVAAVSPNDGWAVGTYINRNNGGTLVERWDGTQWTSVPITSVAASDYLDSVAAVSPNDVWAVGSKGVGAYRTLVEHWDGTQWAAVPSPNIGSLNNNELGGLGVVSSNDIWAVGDWFSHDDGKTKSLIEHWDGTQWTIVPSPNPDAASNILYGVAAIAANDVWAVGYAGTVYSGQTLIMHWDGTTWSLVPSPNVISGPNILRSASAISTNDVWAVGDSAPDVIGRHSTLVLHWDGTQWTIVPSPNVSSPERYSNYLQGVAAMSSADVWAVGYYHNNVARRTLTMHWNGTRWEIASSPNIDGYSNELLGVSVLDSGDVWAAGAYLTGSYQSLMERYHDTCEPSPTETPTPEFTATPTFTPTPRCPGERFSDVCPPDYFYAGIIYLNDHGVVSGYADHTFRPYNYTTRGQLCKIVVLAEGWSLYTPIGPTFSDVPESNAFFQYIETAYQHGVISGYGCGTGCLEFRPNNNVTRDQLSKILVLAEAWAIYMPSTPTFQDVPSGSNFYRYVETAHSHGIITGYDCGIGCLEFRPGNNATRGQICKIMYQAVSQH